MVCDTSLILSVVCNSLNVSCKDIKSSSRSPDIVEARVMFSSLCAERKIRIYEIAWAIGKHRTAVTYYLRNSKALKNLNSFNKKYNDLNSIICRKMSLRNTSISVT